MSFFNWEKHKKWVYTGIVISATTAYFGYQFVKKQNSTKTGIFSRKIKQLKMLILTKCGDGVNIFPLKKVKTLRLKSDSTKLKILVHQVENIKKKIEVTDDSTNFVKDDPFLPPFEKGMFITEIGEHRLLYNKFPCVKNHVLVVSRTFEDQHSLLSAKDFASGFLTIKALKGIAIYNSGPESGASQPHRHIQVLPQGREFSQPITNLINRESKIAIDKEKEFFLFSGFKRISHLVANLKSFNPENEVVDQYAEYLNTVYLKILRSLNNDELHESYNLIWTEQWMMIVLRDKGHAFGKYGINSLGFTGSFLVKNEEDLVNLANYTPMDILLNIGHPQEFEQVD